MVFCSHPVVGPRFQQAQFARIGIWDSSSWELDVCSLGAWHKEYTRNKGCQLGQRHCSRCRSLDASAMGIAI
jgi:hypothetical protein